MRHCFLRCNAILRDFYALWTNNINNPEGAQFKLKVAPQAHESIPVEELDDILYLIEEGFLDEDENLNRQIDIIEMEVTIDEENPTGF